MRAGRCLSSYFHSHGWMKGLQHIKGSATKKHIFRRLSRKCPENYVQTLKEKKTVGHCSGLMRLYKQEHFRNVQVGGGASVEHKGGRT